MSFKLLLPAFLLLAACGEEVHVIERKYTSIEQIEIPTVIREDLIEVIDPCGQEVVHDEIILRLTDRSLIAYFENGGNRFLSELLPGEYVTTDGSNCHFTVTENLEVLYEL